MPKILITVKLKIKDNLMDKWCWNNNLLMCIIDNRIFNSNVSKVRNSPFSAIIFIIENKEFEMIKNI